MHVGVEEAVAERLAEERLHQPPRQRLQVVAGGAERGDIGQPDAVDPFQRQHVARGQLPFDLGHAEALVAGGQLGHLGERGGLQAEVHLDRHRAGQRLDHGDRPQPARRRVDALDEARAGEEGLEVAAEAVADAGPQHLHRDRSAPRPRASSISALWTWAIEAAATGGENVANSASTGRPSARATMARASASGNGAISSRSRPRISAASRPTRSGRVARNWPSLT